MSTQVLWLLWLWGNRIKKKSISRDEKQRER